MTHEIEDAVSVYIRMNEAGEWRVDTAPTVYAGPLLSSYWERGPINDNCGCTDKPDCERARVAAGDVTLPTAVELLHLLADAAGYTLTPVATTV